LTKIDAHDSGLLEAKRKGKCFVTSAAASDKNFPRSARLRLNQRFDPFHRHEVPMPAEPFPPLDRRIR
jgi:hypothetical protein